MRSKFPAAGLNSSSLGGFDMEVVHPSFMFFYSLAHYAWENAHG